MTAAELYRVARKLKLFTRCERTCLGEKVQSVWQTCRLEKPALGFLSEIVLLRLRNRSCCNWSRLNKVR